MSKKKKIKKYIKRFFAGIGIILLLAIVILMIKYVPKIVEYKNQAEALVEAGGDDIFKNSLTSIMYDNKNQVLAELSGSRDSYYIKSEQIPYIVKRAFVVSEDRNFYEHSGVDYKGVMRAIVALVQNEGEVTQGGSTITQQLARNIYLNHEVKLERKIKEIFIAWELEKRYSKEQILEFYINNIYFGNGLYGIEAAAQAYFNKSVTDLTISQMVFLCAIPSNPTLYNPTENIENTIKRRDRILKQMLEQGELDIVLYNEAVNENIVLTPGEKLKNNYEETFARYCATIELMRANGFVFENTFATEHDETEYKKRYNEAYDRWNSMLFTGGYRIYTSIDKNMQEILQNNIDENLKNYTETSEEGVYTFQSSATCIDNKTGYVVAIVGGRTEEQEGYTLNRAYQSFRQPGSSIKPLLVYTPAFEKGYTPNSLVVDEKIEDGPKNAVGYYIGKTNIRTAVTQSINTVAWKMLEEIGIADGINYLKEMNFKRIVKEDYVPAAAIGGFTYGMSTYEMAAGYATLENDGVYRNPTCIRKIVDNDGNVIIDNGLNTSNQKKIYQANASRMMTDVMKDVLTYGTGRKYNISNGICAGKTGTTNDTKDVWFVGYSHYYTTAVWCGYDMPKTIDSQYGGTCAGIIWKGFMEKIHENTEIIDFNPYFDTVPEHQDYEKETTTKETETSTEKETTTKENTTTTNKDNTFESETTTEHKTTTTKPATERITTDDMEKYTTIDAGDGMYTENWN